MGLPKIDQPLFEITVPSSGNKVKYRPFTVKEEKILLIAQETGELDQIILAIKQIINNCVTDIDVEKMPIFDLEYLIMHIRGKSVNNEITFTIKDPDTEEEIELSVNIDDMQIKKDPEHTKKIILNDEYYMMMRYPTLNEISALQMNDDVSETESAFRAMISCIDVLVKDDSDEVYSFSEFSASEITEFVEQFTGTTVAALQKFFTTLPQMKYAVPYKDNTGKKKTFNLEGMDTFFT